MQSSLSSLNATSSSVNKANNNDHHRYNNNNKNTNKSINEDSFISEEKVESGEEEEDLINSSKDGINNSLNFDNGINKSIINNNDELDNTSDQKLKFYHSLGFRSTNQPIQHLENEEEIVYLVGKHVAIFNYEKRTHAFIQKSQRVAEIYCFAISFNRKFIALSERIDQQQQSNVESGANKKNKVNSSVGNAGNGIQSLSSSTAMPSPNNNNNFKSQYQVSIYNFRNAKRVRALPVNSTKNSPVITMAFSRDSKYLVAVTDEPESAIYFWHLEKSNKIAFKKIPFKITQISINPFSYWQFASTGPNDMKIWRFTEGELKHLDPVGSEKYTFKCHSWFDDEKLLVGTEEGHILIIEGKNVIKTISNVHPNSSGINCIEAVDRGFICGGENGYFSVFERTYDSEYFNHYKKFRTFEKQKIIGLCVSKKENNVICCYEDNKFAYFSLANVDILKENETNFTLLPVGFHGDPVNSMSVCTQKSIVATCSNDKTIRLWNFLKRQVELEKLFNEDIFSVSLDPTGTRILVGFRYKLSYFVILSNDLHTICEWHIKSCRLVSFCNGGHLFAAISATSILIISSLTFQVVLTLRGHSGIIKSLVWSKDDRYLASCSFDGTIYEWDLESEKLRVSEYVVKSCAFRSVAYDYKNHVCSGVGNDNKLWTFKQGALFSEIPTKEDLSCITYSPLAEMAFVGTSSGKILLYKWPPDEHACGEYQVHEGSVTSFCISSDGRFLLSLGSDSTLFMMEIEAWKDAKTGQLKGFDFEKFDNIFYSLKIIEEEKDNSISELQEKNFQIISDNERKIQQLIEKYEQEIEKQKSQFTNEIKELKKKIENLKQQINENEISTKEKMNRIEFKHSEETERMRNAHDLTVKEREEKLHREIENLKEKLSYYVDLVKVMSEKHEDAINRLREEYEEEKLLQVETYEQLSKDFKNLSSEYQIILQQSEEDYDNQLKRVKTSLIHTIEKHKQSVIEAKGDSVKKGTKIEELKKEIGLLRNKITKQEEKIHTLEKKNEESKTIIDALQVEKKKNEDSLLIQEKEKKDLLRQAKELEQMRYVLTFKFNKLKNEVSPKEELIVELRDDMKNIEKELFTAKMDNDNTFAQLKQRNEKIDVLQNEISKFKQIVEDKNRIFLLLIQELSALTENNESKSTNLHLKKVVSKYSNIVLQKNNNNNSNNNNGNNSNNGGNNDKLRDTLEEFERQRCFLEQTLGTMKKTLTNREGHMKADLLRKNNENSILVEEINQLRKEQKKYRQKIISLEYQLKNALHFQQQSIIGDTILPFGNNNNSNSNSRASTSRRLSSSAGKSINSNNGMNNNRNSLINRVRTPDSIYSGDMVTGLDKKKVNEFVDSLERNNRRFEQQQQEIDNLKSYVQKLVEEDTTTTVVGTGASINGIEQQQQVLPPVVKLIPISPSNNQRTPKQ
ncbi:hypothetical protein ABK040_010756 [Willaertia magna]